MPTINLENLIRYDSKAKNEAEEEYLPKDSGNWQKTEKAGAVSFYPVGNSPLEGIVDFIFSEVPPASGDKGPENPSTIAGVSSVKVTRCGKNLLTLPYYTSSSTINGVTWTVRDDGTVVADGTCGSSNSNFFIANEKYIPAGTYTFSVESGVSSVSEAVLILPSRTIYGASTPYTFTTDKSILIVCRLRVVANATVSNYEFHPLLELGSSSTRFENGSGADCIISLGSTYYGGSIDLATGLMTVTWEIGVITPQTSIAVTSAEGVFRTGNIFPVAANSQTACSHFSVVSGDVSPSSLQNGECSLRSDGLAMFRVAGITELEAFKSWIYGQYNNGSPVTLAYKLATPTTVQLNPTQILSLSQPDKCMPRLNTVYTDADTIQIGYMKSPQRTEQEITQAILEIESDDSD